MLWNNVNAPPCEFWEGAEKVTLEEDWKLFLKKDILVPLFVALYMGARALPGEQKNLNAIKFTDTAISRDLQYWREW